MKKKTYNRASYPKQTLSLLEDSPYSPENGSFAVPSNDKEDGDGNKIPANTIFISDDYGNGTPWIGCREEFLEETDHLQKNQTSLVFSHPPDKGVNLARFLTAVENRLNLKNHSKISGFKNNKSVSLIEFSPWWVANKARIELFTILLRCGVNYTGNFDTALLSDRNGYIEETETAVRRFLNGYTNFDDKHKRFYGWVDYFSETNKNRNDDMPSYREMTKRFKLLTKTK